jgi:hypothetical protein
MGHRPRPPHIEAAILRGDSAFLSNCGIRGNQRRREIAEAKKAQEEKKRAAVWSEIMQRCEHEWLAQARERNEHIIDADGNDMNYHNRPHIGAHWED